MTTSRQHSPIGGYDASLSGERELVARTMRREDEAFAALYAAHAPAAYAAAFGPVRTRLAVLEQARAYWSLAGVALSRHDYRAAIALTDSSRIGPCMWVGQDTRALALLALGDTVSAEPYLAAFGTNSPFLSADSAKRMLGSHFNAAHWQQAVDSVDAERRRCREAAP